MNDRGVCLVYSRYCTNNFMCVFFECIILTRDDWSNFTDEETKPHRSKLASSDHTVSSGRAETGTQVCKTPKTALSKHSSYIEGSGVWTRVP